MSYVIFPHVEVKGHWQEEELAMQRDLARVMVASARKHMPGIRVFMVTDHNTPALDGIETIRFNTEGHADWIPWLCHACSLMEGEVLYLDSDVVVQRDLRPILNVPGDLILPYRGMKTIDGHLQPFIFGCVAYRTAEIWKEIRDRVNAMPRKERGWYGSQIAVFDMFMEEQNGRGKWKIVPIPRDTYSYTPKDAEDAPKEAWSLHYKGKKRKAWMLEKWRHLIEEQVAA